MDCLSSQETNPGLVVDLNRKPATGRKNAGRLTKVAQDQRAMGKMRQRQGREYKVLRTAGDIGQRCAVTQKEMNIGYVGKILPGHFKHPGRYVQRPDFVSPLGKGPGQTTYTAPDLQNTVRRPDIEIERAPKAVNLRLALLAPVTGRPKQDIVPGIEIGTRIPIPPHLCSQSLNVSRHHGRHSIIHDTIMTFPRGSFRSPFFKLPPAEYRSMFLVSGMALVLSLPFVAGISFADEGYLVHIADRITSGEVLYRDISTGVTPGSFYLHALLFRILGQSLLMGRIFMMALFSMATAMVYTLCRGLTSRGMSVALSLSFAALTVFFWRIPNYSSEAIILVLLAVGSTARFLKTGRHAWLWSAGLGLGAAFVFKQNFGAFAALGVTAGLLSKEGKIKNRLLSVMTTAGVAASSVLLVVLYFAANGALVALWNDVVMIPLHYSATIYSQPYPPLFGDLKPEVAENLWAYLPFQSLFLKFGHPNESLFGLKLVTIKLLFYLPPTFLLVAFVTWLRRRHSPQRCDAKPSCSSRPLSGVTISLGMLYLASSAFLLLGVFPRSDAFHLIKVLVLFFPLMAWVAGPTPGRWPRRLATAITAVLLSLAVLSQGAHVWDPRPSLRRMTFLSLGPARIWTTASTADIVTRRVNEIRDRVPPEEPIFAAPALPLYYFLADRSNPTRYPLILPGGLEEDAVVHAIETQGVRLALVENYGLEQYSFGQVAPVVWKYVLRNFGSDEANGWDLPPYLLTKGGAGFPETGVLLRGTITTAGDVTIAVGAFDPNSRVTVQDLVRDPTEDSPPFRVQELSSRIEPAWEQASWSVHFLRPTLQLISPTNWRKVLVSWEVPAQTGLLFEAACAIAPSPWPNPNFPDVGHGGIAEIWIGPVSDEVPPHRAWMGWLDPNHRPEDRGWHLVGVDPTSFVTTPRARVTLVARPAPTTNPSDDRLVWSGIRLSRRESQRNPVDETALARSSFDVETAVEIDTNDTAATSIVAVRTDDLTLTQRAAKLFPDSIDIQEMLGTQAITLGEYEPALSAFGKILDLSDGDRPRPIKPQSRLVLKNSLNPILTELRTASGLNGTDVDIVMTSILIKLGRLNLTDILGRLATAQGKSSCRDIARTGLHFDAFETGNPSAWTYATESESEGR